MKEKKNVHLSQCELCIWNFVVQLKKGAQMPSSMTLIKIL
jgi:hypothetical protein